MSLNYYLSYKEKCHEIFLYNEEIVNIYDKLLNESFEYIDSIKNEDENKQEIEIIIRDMQVLQMKKTIHDYEIKRLVSLKKYLKIHIQNICQHEFCEDEIDITPERSQKITYCVNCEYTKPNN